LGLQEWDTAQLYLAGYLFHLFLLFDPNCVIESLDMTCQYFKSAVS